MKYLGSKNRISKHILPEILKYRGDRAWVELFVGGANLIDKVGGERYGNDINKYLISLLQELQKGWIPPDKLTRDEYMHVKNNKDIYDDHYVGFVLIPCSFGGTFNGGIASGGGRNYCAEAKRNVLKQAPNLEGIIFTNGDYKDMFIPDNSLIYCDPPYKDYDNGYIQNKFNHDEFWEWCIKKARDGHEVFISEYSVIRNKNIELLKEINVNSQVCSNIQRKNKGRVERLYRVARERL